jgi:hypothetical protein
VAKAPPVEAWLGTPLPVRVRAVPQLQLKLYASEYA